MKSCKLISEGKNYTLAAFLFTMSTLSKKRQRERPAIDVQLIEIYDDLANMDEAIRLKAAHNLLSKFVSHGEVNGDQLDEIFRRLIRGLCSGRKAARLGFSVALTEFLIEIAGPKGKNVAGFQSVPELIQTLKKQTHTSGSNVTGQVSCPALRNLTVELMHMA